MTTNPVDPRLTANPVLAQLKAHIGTLAPHQKERRAGQVLIAAAAELERLLRGDFSESEFQALCHHFSEDDAQRFRQGCQDYQAKLFGPPTVRQTPDTTDALHVCQQLLQVVDDCYRQTGHARVAMSSHERQSILDAINRLSAPDQNGHARPF